MRSYRAWTLSVVLEKADLWAPFCMQDFHTPHALCRQRRARNTRNCYGVEKNLVDVYQEAESFSYISPITGPIVAFPDHQIHKRWPASLYLDCYNFRQNIDGEVLFSFSRRLFCPSSDQILYPDQISLFLLLFLRTYSTASKGISKSLPYTLVIGIIKKLD